MIPPYFHRLCEEKGLECCQSCVSLQCEDQREGEASSIRIETEGRKYRNVFHFDYVCFRKHSGPQIRTYRTNQPMNRCSSNSSSSSSSNHSSASPHSEKKRCNRNASRCRVRRCQMSRNRNARWCRLRRRQMKLAQVRFKMPPLCYRKSRMNRSQKRCH